MLGVCLVFFSCEWEVTPPGCPVKRECQAMAGILLVCLVCTLPHWLLLTIGPRTSQMGKWEKNPPANAEDRGSIPGREDPLVKGTATHSSILARGNPKDRGPQWRAIVHRITKSRTRLSTHASSCTHSGSGRASRRRGGVERPARGQSWHPGTWVHWVPYCIAVGAQPALGLQRSPSSPRGWWSPVPPAWTPDADGARELSALVSPELQERLGPSVTQGVGCRPEPEEEPDGFASECHEGLQSKENQADSGAHEQKTDLKHRACYVLAVTGVLDEWKDSVTILRELQNVEDGVRVLQCHKLVPAEYLLLLLSRFSYVRLCATP